MNREILFRGKRFDNGEWVEGFYVYRPDGKHLIYWKPFDDAKQNTYHIVTPETVGQFTGLLDKNGKRIFEGDIILARSGDKYKVYYNQPECVFVGSPLQHGEETECWLHTSIEVIGTIHDKTKQP